MAMRHNGATMGQPVMIGWRERLDLPEWGVAGLAAKIDTGARTSAIHVENIVPGDGREITFDVILSRKQHHQRVSVTTEWVRRARIRSSNGEVRERFVVATRMIMGGVEKTIELSLVSRQNMLCRMLLGRTALGDDFRINAAEKYLTTE